MKKVHVINHPLVAHKLTIMRRMDTSSKIFRELCQEITMLMAYEMTKNFAIKTVSIQTPVEVTTGYQLDGKKIVLASIFRAGNGMLDGFKHIMPNARIGTIGIYRDHQTLQAMEYHFKMPSTMSERDVIVLDPMLATGNSACAAITRIKKCQPKSIRMMCLLTCPQGIDALHSEHPDVPLYTAAIDRELNDKAYITPGLGDAGDRLFGTK
jgi:uracil phosphoribosyltransferase